MARGGGRRGAGTRSLEGGFSMHPYGEPGENRSNDYGPQALSVQHEQAVALGFQHTDYYATEFGAEVEGQPDPSSLDRQARAIEAVYEELISFGFVKGIWYYQTHDDDTGQWGLVEHQETGRSPFIARPSLAVVAAFAQRFQSGAGTGESELNVSGSGSGESVQLGGSGSSTPPAPTARRAAVAGWRLRLSRRAREPVGGCPPIAAYRIPDELLGAFNVNTLAPGPAAAPRAAGTPRVGVVFAGLMLVMLLAALDSTIVATALPDHRRRPRRARAALLGDQRLSARPDRCHAAVRQARRPARAQAHPAERIVLFLHRLRVVRDRRLDDPADPLPSRSGTRRRRPDRARPVDRRRHRLPA